MELPGKGIESFGEERTVILRESVIRSATSFHFPASTFTSVHWEFSHLPFHFSFPIPIEFCNIALAGSLCLWNGFYSRFYIPLLFIPIVDITLYASFCSRQCITNEWGNIQHDVFIELVDICSLSLCALNNTREE